MEFGPKLVNSLFIAWRGHSQIASWKKYPIPKCVFKFNPNGLLNVRNIVISTKIFESVTKTHIMVKKPKIKWF